MCATEVISAKAYSMPSSAEAPVVDGNIREMAATTPVGNISQLSSSQRADDIIDTINRHCWKGNCVKNQQNIMAH
jgi:hypothetical protein